MRLFTDAVKTVAHLQLRVTLECSENGKWINNFYCLLEDLIWYSQEESESLWDTSEVRPQAGRDSNRVPFE